MIKNKKIYIIGYTVLLLLPVVALVLNEGFYYANYHKQISIKTTSTQSYMQLINNLDEVSSDINSLQINFDEKSREEVLKEIEAFSDVEVFETHTNLVEVRESLLTNFIILISSLAASAILILKNTKYFFKDFLYLSYTQFYIYLAHTLFAIGILSVISRFKSIDTFAFNSITASAIVLSVFIILRAYLFTNEDTSYKFKAKSYLSLLYRDIVNLSILYFLTSIAILLASRESSIDFLATLLGTNLALCAFLILSVQSIEFIDTTRHSQKKTKPDSSPKVRKNSKQVRKNYKKNKKKK